jgi:hypothetical protein
VTAPREGATPSSIPAQIGDINPTNPPARPAMRFAQLVLIFLGVSATVFASDARVFASDARVGPVPAEARAKFRLAAFYTKFTDAGGIPIVASEQVSDFALLEARHLVLQLIGHRPDLLAAIAKNNVRLAVMAPTQLTTDIPEHSDLTPKDHWDKRARGLGATEARPAVSCGEENLLGYPGDPYWTENILIHEFGHVIHQRGMNTVDATFQARLTSAYEAAKRAGLWKGKYAGSNVDEYWAEGVQSWFDTNRENDSEHNHVNTRVEIKTYDPRLSALLAEVFGDGEWKYVLPAKRVPLSAHLAGYDPTRAPKFAWPERLGAPRSAPADASAPSAPSTSGPTLTALAANARPSWRSSGGGKATKVVFLNASSATIQLDWMDFEGRAKTYFTLKPGEQSESATFAGHIWRAKNERGVVLGYFIANDSPATAVVK